MAIAEDGAERPSPKDRAESSGWLLLANTDANGWLKDWLRSLVITIPPTTEQGKLGPSQFGPAVTFSGTCSGLSVAHIDAEVDREQLRIAVAARGVEIGCDIAYRASALGSGEIHVEVADSVVGGSVLVVSSDGEDLRMPARLSPGPDCMKTTHVHIKRIKFISETGQNMEGVVKGILNNFKVVARIACNKLNRALEDLGGEVLRNMSRDAREFMATESQWPMPPPALPEGREYIDFARNPGMRFLSRLVTDYLGNYNSRFSLDALVPHSVHWAELIMNTAITLMDIQLPLTRSFEVPDAGNMTLKILSFRTAGDVNLWPSMTLKLVGPQEVAIGFDTQTLTLHVDVAVDVDLGGAKRLRGDSVHDVIRTQLKFNKLGAWASMRLPLDASNLSVLTIDQLRDPGCVLPGVVMPMQTGARLTLESVTGMVSPEAVGRLETEVDAMINTALEIVMEEYTPTIQKMVSHAMVVTLRNEVNNRLATWTSEPGVCNDPPSNYANEPLGDEIMLAGSVTLFVASVVIAVGRLTHDLPKLQVDLRVKACALLHWFRRRPARTNPIAPPIIMEADAGAEESEAGAEEVGAEEAGAEESAVDKATETAAGGAPLKSAVAGCVAAPFPFPFSAMVGASSSPPPRAAAAAPERPMPAAGGSSGNASTGGATGSLGSLSGARRAGAPPALAAMAGRVRESPVPIQLPLERLDDELLESYPLYRHPRLQWEARLGMPLLAVATILIFLASIFDFGARVEVRVTVDGHEVVQLPSTFEMSLVSTVRDMWRSHSYVLGVLIGFFSGVWPYLKLLMMLVCWFAHPRHISAKRRHDIFDFLDAYGKWSLVDTFMLVVMVVGFRYDLIAVQSRSMDVQALMADMKTDPRLTVYIDAAPGFYRFLLGTVLSLCSGHGMTACNRFALKLVEYGQDEAYLSVQTPSGQIHGRRRLCNMLRQRGTLGDTVFVYGPAAALVVSLIFVLIGIFMETFHFEFLGLAAYLLGPSKSTRPHSVWSLAMDLPQASSDPWSTGVFFTQLAFLFFAVVLAPVYLAVLLCLWIAPLTNREHRRLLVAAQVLNAWSGLDVFVVSILASVMEIRQFAEFMVADKCDFLEKIIVTTPLAEQLPGSTKCFDLTTGLRPGFYFLAISAVVAMVTGNITMRRCSEALLVDSGRRGSCFHTGALQLDVDDRGSVQMSQAVSRIYIGD